IARAIQRPLRRPTLDAVVDGSIRAPGAGIGVCPGRPTPCRARCVTAGGRVLGGPPRGRPAIPDERGIVPVCVSVVEGAGRYPRAALASAVPVGDCDVIRIEHVPEGSPTLAAALTVAEELGWRSLIQPTFLTPWRPLSPTVPWDDGLTRRFRRNLRRAERRLGELGEVCFEVVTTGTRLKQALDVFYRLEASGWKGQRGTAVAQRSQVKRFYDGLVDRAEVWIPILTVC